ncbi:MAG: fructose-1,6-bisphosphate aldolase, partial [Gammaproteobacteria bacterium]
FFAENPSRFDPREYLKPASDAAKRICLARFTEFGCEGQGGRIKPVPLSVMIERYRQGELAQVVK